MTAPSDQGQGATGWEPDGLGGIVDMLGTGAAAGLSALGATLGLLRRKPLLAAVLAAAVVGAGAGVLLADRNRPRAALDEVSRVGRAAGRRARRIEFPIDLDKAWAAPDLLPPLMRLLSNPIVQAYLRRAISGALSRRFAS